MSTRLHIVVSDELVATIDAARGDVPRSRFVRRAVEQMLRGQTTKASTRFVEPASQLAASAEQPQYEHLATCTCWICRPPPQPRTMDADEHAAQMRETIKGDLRSPRVRSSSEARPFRPAPKGKS